MFLYKIIILVGALLLFASCATQGEKRVEEVSEKAHKDLHCSKEDVRVALISGKVIGATGCGRTSYYSILHPFN